MTNNQQGEKKPEQKGASQDLHAKIDKIDETIQKSVESSMNNMYSKTNALRIYMAATILEIILAIPVLGGTMVVLSAYIVLFIALVLHIVALIFGAKAKMSKIAPIIGIVTSLLAWIPILGWLLHTTTAIAYVITLVTRKK